MIKDGGEESYIIDGVIILRSGGGGGGVGVQFQSPCQTRPDDDFDPAAD